MHAASQLTGTDLKKPKQESELSGSQVSLPVIFAIAVVWLIWALWLFQFPVQLSSDDALFFSRGVERFSVVELRPHFPGYPAFVILARVVAVFTDPASAVVMTSLLSVLLLPWVMFRLYLAMNGGSDSYWLAPVLLMFLYASQPLMAALGLSGLSDTTGLLFAAGTMLLIYRQRYIAAGVCLGLLLASRPSYFQLALGIVAVIPLTPVFKKDWFWKIYGRGLWGVMLAFIPTALFILSRDGLAYFDEAVRFTQGHFQIWGNTTGSEVSCVGQWFIELADMMSWPVLVFFLVSLIFSLNDKRICPLGIVVFIYLIWILLAQNPDNMRHFAPVLVFWFPILVTQLSMLFKAVRHIAHLAMVGLAVLLFLTGTNLSIAASPAQQAVQWLQVNGCDQLGTNYKVYLLRELLPECQVYDMYYPSHQALLENNRALRLSGTFIGATQPDMALVAEFPARFTGEKSLYLYRYVEPGE